MATKVCTDGNKGTQTFICLMYIKTCFVKGNCSSRW